MLKSWLIVIVLIPLLGWALTRPMRKTVMPDLLTRGTEQILAQWRDALLAYKADEGQFPPAETKETMNESRMAALSGENKAKKEYLDRGGVAFAGMIPIDAWETLLFFDPMRTGDQSRILSAGPDRMINTPDDLDSANVTNLHLPPPVDPNDDKVRRKVDK